MRQTFWSSKTVNSALSALSCAALRVADRRDDMSPLRHAQDIVVWLRRACGGTVPGKQLRDIVGRLPPPPAMDVPMKALSPALPVMTPASPAASGMTAPPGTILAAVTTSAVDASTHLVDRKPKLRGWLHAGLAPPATAAGVVATILAPSGAATVATAAFTVSALLLFTVSGLYNIRAWSPARELLLRRLDHANIFWFIAGTYTPFTVLLLEGSTRTLFLIAVWSAALAGAAFKVMWPLAPRSISVPPYFALGGASLVVVDDWAGAGAWALGLLALGSLAYGMGGLAYAFRRPNPHPVWFGFHEVFHTATVVAFGCHVAAVFVILGDR